MTHPSVGGIPSKLTNLRCVATDGPTLGGVEPKRTLWTYWTLGGKGMVGVEYLTNVKDVPEGAHFLFAAIKIRGCHGGPGRAIALYGVSEPAHPAAGAGH
jgi:kynurenine formamidase